MGLKPIYSVRVRDLVEFAWRSGDLGGDRDFAGSNRALAGIRGHQKLQGSRPAGYKKEVALVHDLEREPFILRIQGRLDGLLTEPDGVVLEEIKTVHSSWDRVADPLHWAQAKCYGFIRAHDQNQEQIRLQLTYLDLDTGEVTEFRECFSFSELSDFFKATTDIYLDWIQAHHEWRQTRDASIRSLAFPFADFRPGQRKLAVAAYRVMDKGGRLFLEAPTGTGKTVSVLFPAAKAMGEGKLKQIFYLTARTVGRAVAERAFNDMRQGGLKFRTLTLTAREKVCVRNGLPCDESTCPLAVGYYDRCKPAIRAALDYDEINRPILEAVGEKHQVCPFELSLDVSRWTDAIICDYNYVFDPQAYLRRYFAESDDDYGFLVDEAHNLVDRAREMFSGEVDSGEIGEVKRAVKGVPGIGRALGKLNTALQRLAEPARQDELNFVPAPIESLKSAVKHPDRAVRTHEALPENILPLVEHALLEMEKWLARNQAADFRGILLDFFFRLNSFRRVAESYDKHFATIVESSESIRLRLFCLDPSSLLSKALERGKAMIFFSATLTPIDYYRTLLGGMPEDLTLQLPSPFPAENLAVLVHDRIQTHFKAREVSLEEVTGAIGALVLDRPGNYLIYFPSYKYLRAVQKQFQIMHPEVPVMVQSPGMTEAEREAFLASFSVQEGKTLAGFAVMGGVFGEGIDLAGDRLIGAVVVGVGLPQICIERDLIRDYFQEQRGEGFNYAYTFPGMNRVLQAVGRVIRSENDRGVVLLIDRRFAEPRYRQVFPSTWQITRVRNLKDISEALQGFWKSSVGMKSS